MAKASIDQLLAMGQELRDFIHELLEGDTVLLYPSHPMTAPRFVDFVMCSTVTIIIKIYNIYHYDTMNTPEIFVINFDVIIY